MFAIYFMVFLTFESGRIYPLNYWKIANILFYRANQVENIILLFCLHFVMSTIAHTCLMETSLNESWFDKQSDIPQQKLATGSIWDLLKHPHTPAQVKGEGEGVRRVRWAESLHASLSLNLRCAGRVSTYHACYVIAGERAGKRLC